MTAKITHLFLSHGLESGPDSTKNQILTAEAKRFDGIEVIALDHRNTMDPATRLQQLHEAMETAQADPVYSILAGSSMGGWVCAQSSASQPVLGCFLMAPALAMPRYPQSSPQIQARHTQIVHGWDDDVVDPMPVIELARNQGLPMLVLPDGHRLQNSLERLAAEFRLFLQACLK